MKLTGAQIVIKCLQEQGVDTVFGYPGGAILNVYDELYKARDSIKHILTAHEQAACHAADGYSRSTGEIGVVMATSGPGATNLVTGIANAYLDSIPLIAITCNVPTPLLGKDSFQEIDICGITMPITKHGYIVRNVEELADAIREAFVIAKSGRQGPVLLDITKDATAAVTEYLPFDPIKNPDAEFIHCQGGVRRLLKGRTPSKDDIFDVASIINSAKAPVLYVGGGVVSANATSELLEFAEKVNAPVCVSLMGQSAFPNNHPLNTGMVGMHGTKASNIAMSKCDVMLALGARFSDRVVSNPKNFAKNGKIIHIDIDPAEINKNVQTHRSLVGDIKPILSSLTKLIDQREETEWLTKIEELKSHVPSMFTKKTPLHPKFVCEYIHSTIKDDSIIVTEVGQHQMWVSLFYPFTKPRTFLTSGGLGTMGYGTGAAIGAQLGNPDKVVLNIAGDGSFRMNCNELATIGYYNLPIIIIIVNNGTLGMVRQWQNMFYGKRFSETTLDRGPDFVKLAEAYGIKGFSAHTEKEFVQVFDKALSARNEKNERVPVLIDAYIDIDELVLPMVPAGKSIEDTVLEVD